jgi:transcriptional regulator with XRE-family HTH domain
MAMIVRKLRTERGWTQEHLAQLTGLSVRSIQRIERGQSCSLETQNALAAVFEIERSIFNPEEASTNEVVLRPANLAAIVHVKGLEGLLGHAYLFGVFATVGFVIGFGQPELFWCLVGWSIGLLCHGLAVFGFLSAFSPDLDKRDLERRASAVLLQSFVQFGRVSMKLFAQLSGSAALFAGVALLAWVSYDATNVMQTLGLQARMDEAAVASIALLVGFFLVTSGIYIWRRILRPSHAIAA